MHLSSFYFYLLLSAWPFFVLGAVTVKVDGIDDSIAEVDARNVDIVDERRMLQNALDGLSRGLQFMEDHISEINLDGVFGVRLVEELLAVFLENYKDRLNSLGRDCFQRLKKLQQKARNIADNTIPYIKKNEPEYYAKLGNMLEPSENLRWYPSRTTDASLRQSRVSCEEAAFNETRSDKCLIEVIDPEKVGRKPCKLTDQCFGYMTQLQQRGYVLTHQVLFFQLLQKKTTCYQHITPAFEVMLCTNVLRDAEEIAKYDYPLNHRDLFMEQVGLCGYWGFKDFYRPEWLRKILSWQQPSGCYTNYAHWICTENLSEKNGKRVKRMEKLLKDSCLSHKTTVALLAIAASIRYNVEKIGIIDAPEPDTFSYYDGLDDSHMPV